MKDINIEYAHSIYATPCNYKNIFDMDYVHYNIISRRLGWHKQTAILKSDDGVKAKLRSFHFKKIYYCDDPVPHSIYDIHEGWTQWEIKICKFGEKWHKSYLFNNIDDTLDFLIRTYKLHESDVKDKIESFENIRNGKNEIFKESQ